MSSSRQYHSLTLKIPPIVICHFFLDKKVAQKITADENWLTDAGGFAEGI